MLKRLLKVVMPHIPVGSMVHKTFMCYKDKARQQDWIATMKKHLKPELHDEIPKLIAKYDKLGPVDDKN